MCVYVCVEKLTYIQITDVDVVVCFPDHFIWHLENLNIYIENVVIEKI